MDKEDREADQVRELPLDELSNRGLLYEINRLVLHPVGMALAIKQDVKTGKAEGVALLEVDWEFGPDSPGPAKFKAWMEAEGNARMERRRQELGYAVQPRPDDG